MNINSYAKQNQESLNQDRLIDGDLAEAVEKLLEARGVALDAVVSLYLRSMVNSTEQGKSLRLDSTMPFGKYRGELISVIVAADPNYLRYLLGGERPLQMEAEVLAKLQ